MGYVQQMKKEGGNATLEIGLIRSHYIGRTFIQPRQDIRENKVKTKFNTVKGVLKDRVVVIVDDSIVRGTTSKQLVQLIRQAEPKEVHFRVTAPPIMYPVPLRDGLSRRRGADRQPVRRRRRTRSPRNWASIRSGISPSTTSSPRPRRSRESTTAPPVSAGSYPVAIEAGQSKEENEA